MRRGVERRRQRGVALLMVLIALTVLGAMTADFMETNEVYLATAVNHRDAAKAEYLARSGVNLARLLLSVQPLLGEAVNFPFWQYADLLMEPFSGERPGEAGGTGEGEEAGDQGSGGGLMTDLIGLDLSGAEGLGLEAGQWFSVAIVDEDSKVNVNLANDRKLREVMVQQLGALLAPREYDDLFGRAHADGAVIPREDVICEMIDWTDPDEDRCDLGGGEDPSFYHSRDRSYERKNAPFDSLQELHFVRGVNDDFWSAFVDPDPENAERRVMTVWGKGRVNVNTAPPQVLFSLVCMLATDETGVGPCLDPMQRLNLLQLLQGVTMIRTFMPFSKVSDFIAAIENPEERLFLPLPGLPVAGKRQARQMLTTSSSVFSIYAEGAVGKATKRIHAVIDIEGVDMLDPTQSVAASGGSVLYWRLE
jgi:general secretion pathway protein K